MDFSCTYTQYGRHVINVNKMNRENEKRILKTARPLAKKKNAFKMLQMLASKSK